MSPRNNNKQNASSYEEVFQTITNAKNKQQEKDKMMQQALEKLREEQSEGKREQMSKDFNEYEEKSRGVQTGLQTAAEHYGSEYRNYEFGAGNRFASEEQKGRAKKDKETQMAEDWKTTESQESEIQSIKEKQLKIEKALTVVQESLRSLSQEDHVDPEIIKGLEKQEKDLIFQLNTFRMTDPSLYDGSYEKARNSVKNMSKETVQDKEFLMYSGNTNITGATPTWEATTTNYTAENKAVFSNLEYGDANVDIKEFSQPVEQADSMRDTRTPQSVTDKTPSNNIDTLEKALSTNKKEDDLALTSLSAVGKNDLNVERVKESILSSSESFENKTPQALDSRTQGALAKMGVSFDDLVREVPDFAYMSEGARAFVLDKVQQQGVEKIQENAERLFEESKNKSSRLKRIFTKGSLSREAKRQAVQEYKGLENYKDDIQTMVRFVNDAVIKDTGRSIVIDEKTNKPRIEYINLPESQKENKKAKIAFEEYNRAATNLVDVPYEWSLPDATKEQQKAYREARQYFENQEGKLREFLGQNEAETRDSQVITELENMQRDITLAQLMSTHPDVNQELERMESSNWWQDMSYKFKAGGAGFMIGSLSRLSSRALFGLGGAVGASALIGGYLGVVKKNKEFAQDAKDVRRGKNLKDTTNKVFHADKNIDRLDKLTDALQKKSEKSPESIKRSAEAVQDRLRMLDQRLREGRVNFGKGKDQLKNKHELMRAMAHASMVLYGVEKVDSSTFVPNRVRQYFENQDKESLSNRRISRVNAAIIGGSIGASAAFVGALAVDYLKGGQLLESIKESIGTGVPDANITPPDTIDPISPAPPEPVDSNLPPREIVVPPMAPLDPETFTPSDFEVSVDASSRGAIATFEDLKNQLRVAYPDMSQAPEHVQEFVKKSATQLAMEENMFRPDQVDESAKIYKGGKLGFAKNGQLVYLDPRSGFHNLSEGQFTGDHFDYGGTREAAGQVDTGLESKPQSTYTPQTVDETNSRPPYFEGFDDNGVKVKDAPMSRVEEINARNQRIALDGGFEKKMGPDSRIVPLMKGQALEFDILDNGKGSLETSGFEIDSRVLESYHESYLNNTDIRSYTDNLFRSKDFVNANPNVSKAGVDGRLRDLVNAMIARDLAIQKGGFPPASEEFQVLKHERDVLRSIIKNKYESFLSNPLVGSFDGVKNPNPDMLFEVNTSNEAVVGNKDVFPLSEQRVLSSQSNSDIFSPVQAEQGSQSAQEVVPQNQNNSVFPGIRENTANLGPSEGVADTAMENDAVVENPMDTQKEVTRLPIQYGKDTVAAQNVSVTFFENPQGEIVESSIETANINPNFVDLGEFGFDFDEAEKLKSTSIPDYKRTQIEFSMGEIYKAKAIRDTFSIGSREYDFLNKRLETLIRVFDKSYPTVFNVKPEYVQ